MAIKMLIGEHLKGQANDKSKQKKPLNDSWTDMRTMTSERTGKQDR